MLVSDWIAVVALLVALVSLASSWRANRIAERAHVESGRLLHLEVERAGRDVRVTVINTGRLSVYIRRVTVGWGRNRKAPLHRSELLNGQSTEVPPGRAVTLQASGDAYQDVVVRVVSEDGQSLWRLKQGEIRTWRDWVRRNLRANGVGLDVWMPLD